MTDEKKVKKERDPIFMVCLVVLILATCAVTGAFINREYIAVDDTLISDGNKVSVEYTGTYYDYYGNELAVVFDTSSKSIGTDDNIIRASDFNKTSFSNLEFTVGDKSVLTGFENAVIGHQIGDTVYVKIKAGEGYNAPDTVGSIENTEVIIVSASEKMTATQFKEIYKLEAQGTHNFKSLYGWDAVSYYDETTNSVLISYMPEAGKAYTCVEDKNFGKVVLNVTDVSASEIKFTYEVTQFKKVSSDGADIEIQMITVDFGLKHFHITNVTDADGNGVADSFTFKSVDQKYNQDLYFKIKIVSIS